MSEGRRVVAGEAILSGAATIEDSKVERSRVESGAEIGADEREHAGSDACTGERIEALVREHSRLVYRIAYAVLRRHHDAEDATQETFIRVLRYSSKLAVANNPKTWLARIAWRVAVDRSRQRGKTHEIPIEDPDASFARVASSDTPADETMHGIEVGAALERLIAALPDKLRQPLILSAIEEMSPREVAATLAINEAAVRSRVFRARRILRERLLQREIRGR